MILVAATYIHTARHIYEESQFADRRQSFEIGLISTTADIYGQGFDIALYIDEGGTHLNILVGIAALTTIFSQSPDAIENILKYGRMALNYGSEVIQKSREEFKLSEGEIDWKQRRTGDVRKMISVVENAELLRQGQLRKDELSRARHELNRNLYRLLLKVSNPDELKPLLGLLPHDKEPSLPRIPREIIRPKIARRLVAESGTRSLEAPRSYSSRPPRRRVYETTLRT